jgi:hypothetical protein
MAIPTYNERPIAANANPIPISVPKNVTGANAFCKSTLLIEHSQMGTKETPNAMILPTQPRIFFKQRPWPAWNPQPADSAFLFNPGGAGNLGIPLSTVREAMPHCGSRIPCRIILAIMRMWISMSRVCGHVYSYPWHMSWALNLERPLRSIPTRSVLSKRKWNYVSCQLDCLFYVNLEVVLPL